MLLEVGLVFGTLSTFLPLRVVAAAVDFSPGWFYTAAAISSFTVRLSIAKWSDRLGRGVFVTVALCFYVLAMLGLSQAAQSWHFWLCGFTEGIAGGIFIPATIVILADRTQPNERATVIGWAWMGFDLGIALAGPLAGSLAQTIGLPRVFLAAAGLAAIALISFLTLSTATVRSSVRFALGQGQDSYAL
ncbi:MAG: MFS transporter [Oscillatoriales cyanobacterium SM2_1_8]|nr:MFS transporter [Oscillatoriales cyanobacterium SM2_1_8]